MITSGARDDARTKHVKNKMISRRDIISRSATMAGAFLAGPYLRAFANTASASTLANDVHSQLNPTPVNRFLDGNLPRSWLIFCGPLRNRGARLAWQESVMQWEVNNSPRIPI
jgi:hypothetical protein